MFRVFVILTVAAPLAALGAPSAQGGAICANLAFGVENPCESVTQCEPFEDTPAYGPCTTQMMLLGQFYDCEPFNGTQGHDACKATVDLLESCWIGNGTVAFLECILINAPPVGAWAGAGYEGWDIPDPVIQLPDYDEQTGVYMTRISLSPNNGGGGAYPGHVYVCVSLGQFFDPRCETKLA